MWHGEWYCCLNNPKDLGGIRHILELDIDVFLVSMRSGRDGASEERLGEETWRKIRSIEGSLEIGVCGGDGLIDESRENNVLGCFSR